MQIRKLCIVVFGRSYYQHQILVHGTHRVNNRYTRSPKSVLMRFEDKPCNEYFPGYGYCCYGYKPFETNIKIKKYIMASGTDTNSVVLLRSLGENQKCRVVEYIYNLHSLYIDYLL